MRRAMLLLAILLLAVSPALALVDLASPIDDVAVANGTLTFEYYASVPGLVSCSVNVAPYAFPDPDVQNSALNDVEVQDIPDGTYAWNVTCVGDTTESSAMRTFTVDSVPPTIAVMAPANATTAAALTVDIIPADDRSATLSCVMSWNGNQLESIPIASNARTVRSYQVPSGTGTLRVVCSDGAGNTVVAERTVTVQIPLHLALTTDKASYGPLEPVRLTVDTINGANVTVDICPNQTGFVQCTTALLGSSGYPQSFTLPYMNRTGTYLIEVVARLGNQTRINQTGYAIENTLVVSVARNATPKPGVPINLSASATGGVGPYRFSWAMHNGTNIGNATSVTVTYAAAQEYTDRVTAYDSANNSREFAVVTDVRSTSAIQVRVYDNATGASIDGASVSIGDEDAVTFDGGIALFTLPSGTYDLIASATGYRFSTGRYVINGSRQIDVGLVRDVDVPIVAITAPQAGQDVTSPASVEASVSHPFGVTCTLYLGAGDGWFSANGTGALNGSGTLAFARNLPAGPYQAKVECVDSRGRVGSSAPVSFTVSGAGIAATAFTPSGDGERLQQELDMITAAVDSLDKYGTDEREAIGLTGFDRDLRNARRALQQAIRDIDALQFRADLDAAGREAERTGIIQRTDELLSRTPRSLRIADKEMWVRYATEEQVADAADLLAGKDGMTEDADALARLLVQDQQRFTVSTTMLSVELSYPDGSQRPITVVHRTFTYAPEVDDAYRIIEVIPKEVASRASEIQAAVTMDVIEEDPIIAFTRADTVTYIIPKRVDRALVEGITTLLARRYAAGEDSDLLTGFAILGGLGVPEGWSWLAWLVGVLAFLYVVWYFDLVKQARYLVYRLGRKEKVRYLRVIINDAQDQIGAGDYGKAEMLYKEVRLTYETLPVPARNDLYEDVMLLVRRMDTYYFNTVMIEMDKCLKADDHEGAIAAYEKLLGTFERLDAPQQEQLVQTVAGLGRRLGMGVPA